MQQTMVKPASAAEIIILRDLHGADAIDFLAHHDGEKLNNAEEVARLRQVYGSPVFSKVFPGSLPKLPTLLVDSGIEIPEPVSKKAPKAE